MSSGPEENCTQRVEGEAHQDCRFISKSFENFSSNWGEEEITVGQLTLNTQRCNSEATHPPPKYMTWRPVDCSLVMFNTAWKCEFSTSRRPYEKPCLSVSKLLLKACVLTNP